MGWLRHEKAGKQVPLEPVHLVGRTERCALVLQDSRVSHEHASFRWDGDTWTIKDLGSLNRTFVNGEVLVPGEVRILRAGARVSFGTEDETWILASGEPPAVMAVPVLGGPAVVEQGGLLALPSAEHPALTLFRAEDGGWFKDDEVSVEPISDQMIFQVGLERYRFCLPQVSAKTSPIRDLQGCCITDLSVDFLVSLDFEHIELVVRYGPIEVRLPARSHNEVLLLLARARREDVAAGLPAPNCGWVPQDQVAQMTGLDPEHLNVQIFRIRRQFAELGLLDPAQVVERRPRNRQLRFGVPGSSEAQI